MNRRPPKKTRGEARGHRVIDGEILDVRSAAQLLGTSENTIRARVARRSIPYRRWGGRIIFKKGELEQFLNNLPGCSLEEALKNHERR